MIFFHFSRNFWKALENPSEKTFSSISCIAYVKNGFWTSFPVRQNFRNLKKKEKQLLPKITFFRQFQILTSTLWKKIFVYCKNFDFISPNVLRSHFPHWAPVNMYSLDSAVTIMKQIFGD